MNINLMTPEVKEIKFDFNATNTVIRKLNAMHPIRTLAEDLRDLGFL